MPLPAAVPILGKVAAAVGPLLMGLFGGKKSQQAADQRTAGATLPDLLPLLLPLIQQMQQRSNQSYGMQMDRYQSQQPLHGALSKMAMGLMPTRYTQGMGQAPPQSSQPPIQPLPLPGTTARPRGAARQRER